MKPDQAMIPAPPSATKKWVTFDDLIDDAMESGKLCTGSATRSVPMTATAGLGHRRRNSVSLATVSSASSLHSSVMSSSVGSSASFDSVDNISEARKTSIDFTQSLGSHSLASNVLTCMRKPEPEYKSEEGVSEQEEKDKYTTAFKDIREKKGRVYHGWSNKVLHGSDQLGWSDELLGYEGSGSGTDEEAGPAAEVATPESAWGVVGSSVITPTWDKSPSRTFVRNFP